MSIKELLNGVGVPFVDWQCFLDIAIVIYQFDNWIKSAQIFDGQIGEFGWSVTFDESLNLWICAKFAGAHFQYGFRVTLQCRRCAVLLTALFAVIPMNKVHSNTLIRCHHFEYYIFPLTEWLPIQNRSNYHRTNRRVDLWWSPIDGSLVLWIQPMPPPVNNPN